MQIKSLQRFYDSKWTLWPCFWLYLNPAQLNCQLVSQDIFVTYWKKKAQQRWLQVSSGTSQCKFRAASSAFNRTLSCSTFGSSNISQHPPSSQCPKFNYLSCWTSSLKSKWFCFYMLLNIWLFLFHIIIIFGLPSAPLKVLILSLILLYFYVWAQQSCCCLILA